MIIFNKKRDIRHSYIPLSAVGQNRTVDTRIFSPLLYRLSYNGKNNKELISDFFTCVKYPCTALFYIVDNLFGRLFKQFRFL